MECFNVSAMVNKRKMMGLLEKIKYKLNIYRRYRYWKKQRCIFIHVPKVAGTSINRALYGKTLGHYSALEVKDIFPELFANCFVFSFVRNPWDRALSAYNFAKVGATDTMAVYNNQQYNNEKFRTFEAFVKEWLPEQNINSLDFIFQPQSKFLFDSKGKCLVNFIGKLETINKDLMIVEERMGRQLSLSHENKTSSGSSYREFYKDKEMIKIIGKLYEKDVKNFNYQF